ncbi:MAG: prolipoprotein diacylglyceryl transferase [Thermoflexales bacterium]|nr:prolipoprotein diacylglyceryl transferase [Thermoflexales bacterium]
MDPSVAIPIPGWPVYWYGILIMLGVMSAGYVASLEAQRRGENPEIVSDGIVWVLLLGVVGARLYHVFSSPNDGTNSGWAYYSQNPLAILDLRNGGLGIFGGLAGGILGVIIVIKRARRSLWRWFDCIVPGVLLAQSIARWGNFANQELYGGPTGSSWWGITIDAARRTNTGRINFQDLQAYPLETRFHPTFFYESAWNFAGFVLMMWASRRFERWLRTGDLAGIYFIWYGLGRLWTEMLFRPDAWTIGALPTAAWVSLGSLAFGLGVLLVNHALARGRRPAVA